MSTNMMSLKLLLIFEKHLNSNVKTQSHIQNLFKHIVGTQMNGLKDEGNSVRSVFMF